VYGGGRLSLRPEAALGDAGDTKFAGVFDAAADVEGDAHGGMGEALDADGAGVASRDSAFVFGGGKHSKYVGIGWPVFLYSKECQQRLR
jgi:hypothetical protein